MLNRAYRLCKMLHDGSVYNVKTLLTKLTVTSDTATVITHIILPFLWMCHQTGEWSELDSSKSDFHDHKGQDPNQARRLILNP